MAGKSKGGGASEPVSSTSPKRDTCKHDQIVVDSLFQDYKSLTRKESVDLALKIISAR
jgi:hypothetical protein